MAKQRVKVVDRGLRKIVRNMKAADGIRTAIGIQGSEAGADHDGMTNATLGAIHEFGAPSVGIPQRSFIGATFDANRKKYERYLSNGIGKAIDTGGQPAHAFELTGELHKSDIINAINSGIAPPLAARTIARKGSSKQLIDSGQLKGSLTVRTENR